MNNLESSSIFVCKRWFYDTKNCSSIYISYFWNRTT